MDQHSPTPSPRPRRSSIHHMTRCDSMTEALSSRLPRCDERASKHNQDESGRNKEGEEGFIHSRAEDDYDYLGPISWSRQESRRRNSFHCSTGDRSTRQKRAFFPCMQSRSLPANAATSRPQSWPTSLPLPSHPSRCTPPRPSTHQNIPKDDYPSPCNSSCEEEIPLSPSNTCKTVDSTSRNLHRTRKSQAEPSAPPPMQANVADSAASSTRRQAFPPNTANGTPVDSSSTFGRASKRLTPCTTHRPHDINAVSRLPAHHRSQELTYPESNSRRHSLPSPLLHRQLSSPKNVASKPGTKARSQSLNVHSPPTFKDLGYMVIGACALTAWVWLDGHAREVFGDLEDRLAGVGDGGADDGGRGGTGGLW